KGKPVTFDEVEHAIIPPHLQAPPLKLVIFEKFTPSNTHHSGRTYLSRYLSRRNISGENVMIALIARPETELIQKYRLPAVHEARYLWITDKTRRRHAFVHPDDIIGLKELDKLTFRLNQFFQEKGENAVVYVETFALRKEIGDKGVIRKCEDIVGQPDIFKGILLINYGRELKEMEKTAVAYAIRLKNLASTSGCVIDFNENYSKIIS
ncbi:TPA: hypothetical protein H1005_04530, partial [archaeon]|nr:hypothetical protein [Candidatus Naiadarchaeales archaeon SRR2090153.bin1042]